MPSEPVWTKIIREKLPQKAKNLEDNFKALLLTRQRRSTLGQLLLNQLNRFRFFEDCVQRQIKFSQLFGTAFAHQLDLYLTAAIESDDARVQKAKSSVYSAIDAMLGQDKKPASLTEEEARQLRQHSHQVFDQA